MGEAGLRLVEVLGTDGFVETGHPQHAPQTIGLVAGHDVRHYTPTADNGVQWILYSLIMMF